MRLDMELTVCDIGSNIYSLDFKKTNGQVTDYHQELRQIRKDVEVLIDIEYKKVMEILEES